MLQAERECQVARRDTVARGRRGRDEGESDDEGCKELERHARDPSRVLVADARMRRYGRSAEMSVLTHSMTLTVVDLVLLGDFNADADAASIRFLTGKQAPAGVSVRYEDAWAAAHPGSAGHAFSAGNPLVRAGQMPRERGRRIDHVLIRSGAHGPLLDVADCRLIFDQPADDVWASDHFGVLADLRRPDQAPGTWASPGEKRGMGRRAVS